MKAFLTILLTVLTFVSSYAYRYSYDFRGTPVSEAIVRISKDHPDVGISFIYKELGNYRTSARIRTDDPYEALRQAVGMNPVSVVSQDGHFYVEARQHGKFTYTGRAIGPEGSPLPGVTVMLLNPKDSTFITYGISDDRGRFSIACDRRNVLAKLSCVGYRTAFRRNDGFTLGDITMQANTVTLKQLAVKADKALIQQDRTVFIPGKREKNAAHDAVGLLRTMAIPLLRVNPMSGNVTTAMGSDVAFFIDYLPADGNQLQGLRTQDVRSVEIYDYPSDPRFQGAKHVVNFVMVNYEYGGYSKISLSQKLPDPRGNFSANSKFTYRRMTFDADAGYSYGIDNSGSSVSETVYTFPEQTVTRHSRQFGNRTRNNTEYATFRATYSSEKCRIQNTVGYQGDGSRRRNRTENSYTPDIQADREAAMREASRSNSATWRGTYQFFLPHDFTLNITPSLRYSHHRNDYTWTQEPVEVRNLAYQDAWSGNIDVYARRQWGRQSLSINAFGEFSDNRLRYLGTNPDRVDNNSTACGIGVSANLHAENFSFSPSVRAYYSHTHFGDEDYDQILPAYYVEIGWQPHPKHKLELSSEMSNWTIGVAYRSPNIVVRDVLDAVTGNPALKTYLYNSVALQYQWSVLPNLFAGAWCNYQRWTKPISDIYTPQEIDGRMMMLRSLVKDGYYQTLEYGVSANLDLLNRLLNIWGQATGSNCRRGGMNRYSGNFFRGNIGASYYLGDFYFSAWYSSPYRTMNMSTRDIHGSWDYGIEAGWSHKGLNISLSGTNLFRTDRKGLYTRYQYQNYTSWSQTYGHSYTSAVTLRLSYSISYGRKLRIESGPGRTGSISSGILK